MAKLNKYNVYSGILERKNTEHITILHFLSEKGRNEVDLSSPISSSLKMKRV